MTREELLALLESTAQSLGEHFDTVQIITTEYHGDTQTTRALTAGTGNWYARQASVQEYLERSSNIEIAEAIASKLEPPDDDWRATP